MGMYWINYDWYFVRFKKSYLEYEKIKYFYHELHLKLWINKNSIVKFNRIGYKKKLGGVAVELHLQDNYLNSVIDQIYVLHSLYIYLSMKAWISYALRSNAAGRYRDRGVSPDQQKKVALPKFKKRSRQTNWFNFYVVSTICTFILYL